jgi:hypothetical protein
MNKAAVATPTRLVSVPPALRVQQREAPVAVLARLLAYGAEMSERRGAVVLIYKAAVWAALPDDRRTYVLRQLARYRNLYAVIRADRPACGGAGCQGPADAAKNPHDQDRGDHVSPAMEPVTA